MDPRKLEDYIKNYVIFVLFFAAVTTVVGFAVFYSINSQKADKELFSANLLLPAQKNQGSVKYITKAFLLDKNKKIIEDITDKVKNKDDIWATAENNQYIRITFERELNNANDITIYARQSLLRGAASPQASGNEAIFIEVYPVYPDGVIAPQPAGAGLKDGLIAKFPEIKQARSYKVYLNNLVQPTDTFDLKIVSLTGLGDLLATVEVDWVTDPSEAGVSLNSGVKLLSGIQLKANCGGTLTDARDSQTYTTVQIGNQCWMRQNINVGTLTAGVNSQGTDCPSVSAIEKYCYSDTESNCTAEGGLYQWDQMMCGGASCNGTGASQPACSSPVQGICPTGWHIPSHYEYVALERAVCTSRTCITDFLYNTSTTGWLGTTEGDKLKNTGLCQGRTPCGTSGFNGLLAGDRDTGGSFFSRTSRAYFWSSTQISSANAWGRLLLVSLATVYRGDDNKAYGFSVRCLKN